MARSLEAKLDHLQKTLGHLPDVVFKKMNVGQTGIHVIMIYLSGIADTSIINEQIVKPLILTGIRESHSQVNPEKIKEELIQQTAFTIDMEEETDLETCVHEVLSGNTCLLIEGTDEVFLRLRVSFRREVSMNQALKLWLEDREKVLLKICKATWQW